MVNYLVKFSISISFAHKIKLMIAIDHNYLTKMVHRISVGLKINKNINDELKY